MGAFRYYFGYLYIVYQPKKGFWNQDKKKYVYNVMKATLYKNKKCAKDKAKKLGRAHKVLCCRLEEPDWW